MRGTGKQNHLTRNETERPPLMLLQPEGSFKASWCVCDKRGSDTSAILKFTRMYIRVVILKK